MLAAVLSTTEGELVLPVIDGTLVDDTLLGIGILGAFALSLLA